ncbi:MAG: hypothetical protein JWN15_931 [Firmicutes bacterium]|nr:hypothetical protein [Bacillota bacterium]
MGNLRFNIHACNFIQPVILLPTGTFYIYY